MNRSLKIFIMSALLLAGLSANSDFRVAHAEPYMYVKQNGVVYLKESINQLVSFPATDVRVAKFVDMQNGYTVYVTTTGGIAVVK